jgi:hypothetical protein
VTRTSLTPLANSDASTPIEDDASRWTNRRATQLAHRAAQARKGSGRRRLVDPATCDRDYSRAEMEFMQAMQEYKTASGRLYPTWSEVLEVVYRLGYQKIGPASDRRPGQGIG